MLQERPALFSDPQSDLTGLQGFRFPETRDASLEVKSFPVVSLMALSKVPSGARLARSTPFEGVTRFSESSWTPNTDVFLTERFLVIQVEVAGMRREDLSLKAEGNRLRVRGKRNHDDRPTQCKFILMEIDFGTFQFYIDLPAGYNLHKAKAVYQNGFLRINVPIASRASSKKIDVSIPTEEADE